MEPLTSPKRTSGWGRGEFVTIRNFIYCLAFIAVLLGLHAAGVPLLWLFFLVLGAAMALFLGGLLLLPKLIGPAHRPEGWRWRLAFVWLWAGAALNFILFAVHSQWLGGSAANGKVVGGQYFVGEHGVYSLVSRPAYYLNFVHYVTAMSGLALALLGCLAAAIVLRKNRAASLFSDPSASPDSPARKSDWPPKGD